MTLKQLQKRWQNKTGEPMPAEIAGLPMDRIERAVQIVERGDTVFVPKHTPRRVEESASSLREWDKDSEF